MYERRLYFRSGGSMLCVSWIPHPVIVTRDIGDYFRVLLILLPYHYHIVVGSA